jgi:predicted MFS family arabinose efflux permease
MIAVAATGAMHPLLTQIYQDNYPAASRGRFFSRTMVIRIASAVGCSAAVGSVLARDLGYFRAVLILFAAALAFSSWCLNRVPSAALHASGGGHPFRALRHVRHDAVFRITLAAWMLMGFGNLMMLPLRIEYLANPAYALGLSADTIAFLTGVVPNVARLVMSPVWGWLFDRANFFVLRITLNLGFAIGVAAFFTSDTMTGFMIAAVVHGISAAGGDLAWSLWVTKIAPPERVAEYMSVHTFFTGVRGLLAPMLGFALVAHWSLSAMGFVAAAMILAASLLLVPEARRQDRVRRPVTPVPPPASAEQG